MDSLTQEQDRLLAMIAAGELAETSEAIVAETQRCPAFALELQRLRETLLLFQRAAAESRVVIEEAMNSTERAPGQDHIRDTVKRWLGVRKAPSSTSSTVNRRVARGRVLGGVFALAAVIAVCVLLGVRAPKSALGPRYLGEEVRCVMPKGGGADFRSFTFEGALPDGAWFEIVIEAPNGSEIHRSPRLDGREYQLTEDQARALPEEILWHVRVYDIGGLRATARATARR